MNSSTTDAASSFLNADGQPGLLPTTPRQTAIIGALLLTFGYRWISASRKTVNVPGVGYPPIPFISSWIAAFRFMYDPVGLVRKGIEKYKGGLFRIATLQGEYVLVPDREKVAEYIRVSDDVLGMQEAANDQQQLQWTMGYGITHRPYHTPVVRNQVTKSIELNLETMMEEMRSAFEEMLGSPKDYRGFGLYDIIATTVARTSNRVFVGASFAKDKEYIRNAVDYAQGVVISAELLRPFPDWTKDFLIKIAPVAKYRRKAMRMLGATIKDRLDESWRKGGEKPDDLIQWLIENAPPIEKTVPCLIERIMALNVASIHTTTMTFTSALYNLAAEPDKYVAELRGEIKEHCFHGQITRDTLAKLVKMDSFLREAGRYNNAGLLSMQRNAKRPFTFSDGTVIPPGAKIGTPVRFVQRDPGKYENPEVFDGFRFSRPKEASNSSVPSTKDSVATTDVALQLFGHGRHACPGRFFAVAEMKLMFILLLTHYELRLEEGAAPKQLWIGTMALPDTTLKVLVKRRDV